MTHTIHDIIEESLVKNGYTEKTFNHYWKGDKNIIVKDVMLHHTEIIYYEGKTAEDVLNELRALKLIE